MRGWASSLCWFRSRMPPNGWRGHWIHLQQDLVHALMSRRAERLSWRDYARPYRSKPAFAVWSIRDPMPFVHEWAHAGRHALRLMMNPSERRSVRARMKAIPPGGLSSRPDGRDS